MATRIIKTTRWQIATYWLERNRFVSDIGEPSCFACGYYNEDWDDPAKTEEKRWNYSGLERAHIIADYLGGLDAPSNYLLLCKDCHLRAPMTNDYDLTLHWAETQEGYYCRTLKNFEADFKRLGGQISQVEKLLRLSRKDLGARIVKTFTNLDLDSHPYGTRLSGTFAARAALCAYQMTIDLSPDNGAIKSGRIV